MENMILKYGEDLKKYVESKTSDITNERYFVDNVRRYLNRDSTRGLLITGLRSTGKTTGILSAIDGANAVYISALRRPNTKGVDILNQLQQLPRDTIIVVDEYSWIDDNAQLTEYLSSQVELGRKVIITGTDSAKIQALKDTDFIHRVNVINTNYFSYDEFCHIYNLTPSANCMEKYLTKGGVFESGVSTSFGSTRDYIQNAIIDNLVSYYPQYDPKQLKACIYTIFYDCACNCYSKKGYTSVPIYSYDTSLDYEEFLERFGVDTSLQIDDALKKEVSRKLSDIGVTVVLNDLRVKGRTRAYLTNQALSCQMVKAIAEIDGDLDAAYMGHLYEAAVVCNVYMNKIYGLDNPAYNMSFLDGRKAGQDYEIDFILSNDENAYIFECKYSSNDKFNISDKASIVKDIIPNLLGDRSVAGRYVIYRGQNKVGNYNDKDVVFTNNWNLRFDKFDDYVEKFNTVCDDAQDDNDCTYETILPLNNTLSDNNIVYRARITKDEYSVTTYKDGKEIFWPEMHELFGVNEVNLKDESVINKLVNNNSSLLNEPQFEDFFRSDGLCDVLGE